MDFKNKKEKILKDFITDMSEVRYWENISKKIEKFSKDSVKSFSLSFEHDLKSKFAKDDELKIEALADVYGYKIINEDINALNTIYYFERK